MDASCRIRPALPADADRLAELERVCFPDPWSREGLAEVLASTLCISLVIEVGGEVVGYALARRVEIGRAHV